MISKKNILFPRKEMHFLSDEKLPLRSNHRINQNQNPPFLVFLKIKHFAENTSQQIYHLEPKRVEISVRLQN